MYLFKPLITCLLPVALLLGGHGCSSSANRLNTVARESEVELNRLREADRQLKAKIESLEQSLNAVKRKTDTFCIVSKNGEFKQIHPAGSRECNIR
jgi:uncharacterized protein YlxW (UPF0749 family)